MYKQLFSVQLFVGLNGMCFVIYITIYINILLAKLEQYKLFIYTYYIRILIYLYMYM